MVKIDSAIKTSQPEFKEQYKFHLNSVETLQTLIAEAKLGGGEHAIASQNKRGKWTARQRIETLLDKDSFFLELSPLAGHKLYKDAVPGASLVSGVGQINGT